MRGGPRTAGDGPLARETAARRRVWVEGLVCRSWFRRGSGSSRSTGLAGAAGVGGYRRQQCRAGRVRRQARGARAPGAG